MHDRTPVCQQFPGHGCTDGLTTERDFDSQATWVIAVVGLYCDMLSTGFCTTKHWQTTGRLVQELNVCTVCANFRYQVCCIPCFNCRVEKSTQYVPSSRSSYMNLAAEKPGKYVHEQLVKRYESIYCTYLDLILVFRFSFCFMLKGN